LSRRSDQDGAGPCSPGVWTRGAYQQEAPQTFRGIPIADLVATQWIKIFPDDAAIRLDNRWRRP